MGSLKHRDIFAKDRVWNKAAAGIEYVLFNMDEADSTSPMMILTRFEPGANVVPHTHASNYFEYLVSGDQTVGNVTFRAGDVRLVKGGTGYGPITVGPEGCTVLIVFQHGDGGALEPLPRTRTSGML